MAEYEKPDASSSGSLFQDTFSGLRGRQSVRATFKLSDGCIEAISIAAAQLGIKQKSLFDHLLGDVRSLSNIARKYRNARLDSANRVQKTFVMSRDTLVSLEDAAKSFNTPRDVLIEFSVQRLLPMIEDQRKRHARRKAIFERVQKHLVAGRRLLEETHAELGEEDLLTERLHAAMTLYESAYRHMRQFIEKSESIETFEPGTFTKIDIVFEDE